MKAQNRFCRITRIVRRDSCTTLATASRSLRMTTTSPACAATSVPPPIAMPRSAAARAGASLIPSHTIATTRPPALRLGPPELGYRACGAELRDHASNAGLLRDRRRRAPLIAAQHDDLESQPSERLDRGRRAWARGGRHAAEAR